jgi:hypothetical protein
MTDQNSETQVRSIMLKDDQLMERYLRVRLRKEEEFEFRTPEEIVVGFISAIDNKWVHVCETDTLDAWLLQLGNLLSVKTTNRTLEDVEPKKRKEIRRFCGMMFKIAKGSTMEHAGQVG